LNVVLRRLRDQVILHAALRFQVKHGSHLETSAQRDQHATGYIAHRISGLQGLRAVDINMKFWVVSLLLNTQVGDAADMAELFEHLVGNAGIRTNVCTLDLDIDGCRQPEVQSLGGNVGREKGERDAWKLPRQPITESTHIIRGRMML